MAGSRLPPLITAGRPTDRPVGPRPRRRHVSRFSLSPERTHRCKPSNGGNPSTRQPAGLHLQRLARSWWKDALAECLELRPVRRQHRVSGAADRRGLPISPVRTPPANASADRCRRNEMPFGALRGAAAGVVRSCRSVLARSGTFVTPARSRARGVVGSRSTHVPGYGALAAETSPSCHRRSHSNGKMPVSWPSFHVMLRPHAP